MTSSDTAPVLTFNDGIPGFPELRRFMLLELVEDGAFQELRSPDDPDFAMIVCMPWLFFPDYAPELGDDAQEELSINEPEDAVVFCPVTLDESGDRIYVNLLGPFVVNAATRVGRQVVLSDSDYPVRAPIELGSA